ncbi:MAG: 3-isopropylmalate dehydrogenase [Parvularculaceae bacterium]|nr:3-isopropylmalate dehydrogenase [Parvularculaceae bacterium]
MSTYTIAVLPGDGVGPEVISVACDVLGAVTERFGHQFKLTRGLIGGAAIDATGGPLPEGTLELCRKADAILLGAVGGPKWDQGAVRPEQGLLAIRKELGVFANLRPVVVHGDLVERSPLKREIVEGVDLIVFRELTGGAYFGEKRRTADAASDLGAYTSAEIERIARAAFKSARRRRRKVTSVDKANVMEAGRLWRETVSRVHREEFPDVALEHVLIDAMAMHVLRWPRNYDIILTDNMFGDILSDELSALADSIGLAPSASLGASGPGLFEPVHGSAPDIAGRNLANPVGAVLSTAMMLRYGLRLEDEADAVEAAVSATIAIGAVTADLGGDLGCREVGDAILHALLHPPLAHYRLMHWG